jgi:hypothetical protein
MFTFVDFTPRDSSFIAYKTDKEPPPAPIVVFIKMLFELPTAPALFACLLPVVLKQTAKPFWQTTRLRWDVGIRKFRVT